MEGPYPEEVSASDRVEPRVEPSVEPKVLRKGEKDPNDESRPDKEVANCCISRWIVSLINLCHAWNIFRRKPSFLARAWSLIRQKNDNKQNAQKTAKCLTLEAFLFSPCPPLYSVSPDPHGPGLSRDGVLVETVSTFLLFQATLPLMVSRRPPKFEGPPDQQQTTSLQITRKNGTKEHWKPRFYSNYSLHTRSGRVSICRVPTPGVDNITCP